MPFVPLQDAPLTGGFDDSLKKVKAAMRMPDNEDAMLREFTVMGARAALVYIDGLANDEKLQWFVLTPCLRAQGKDVTLEKLMDNVLPIGSAKQVTRLSALINRVYSGDAALLCQNVDGALILDVKGFVKRGVQTPATEMVVTGPQEAFTESLRDNVVLLRRLMRTPALISEQMSVGAKIPSRLCLLYLEGVAKKEYIDEITRRIEGCNVDYLSSIGVLEQLLEDSPSALVPQVLTTERPDRAVSFLLSGQVLIAMENAPSMLAMPMNIVQLFHAPDDTALRWQYGTFIRLLRLVGILAALFVPALFVALTSFHPEGMPLSLLTSVQESQSRMPIGIFPSTLLMLAVFSLINEASTRVPAIMGGSLGVVSALILGQAAAEADLVSPLLIVLVALSGLGSFVMPDYAMSIALRIAQFALVLASGVAGYFGLALCAFFILLRTLSQTSLFSPLCAPIAPNRPQNPDILLRYPVWRQRLRGFMANPASMLRTGGRMRDWED